MEYTRVRALLHADVPVVTMASIVADGVAPMAVGRVKVMLMRRGAAWLFGGFGMQYVRAGQVIVLAPGVLCGSTTIETVEVVTAYLNPQFVLDQMRWAFTGGRVRRRAFAADVARVTPAVQIVAPAPEGLARLERLLGELALIEDDAGAGMKAVSGGVRLIAAVSDLLDDEVTIRPSSSLSEPVRADLRSAVPLRTELVVAVRLLHDQYAEPWTLQRLATAVGLSPSALARSFKSALGMTPAGLLHRIRLARFEQLVTISELSFQEATLAVGWTSASYTRELMIRNHGLSPRQLREIHLAGS